MAPVDEATRERVLTSLSPLNYHRTFHLPPNPSTNPPRTKPLRITYADYGRPPAATPEEEVNLPTIWFCGGMFAGRWVGAAVDEVLKREGLRMIVVDRPGMGGSGNVPVNQRLSVYLEIMVHLLKHLEIKYVTLAANSGGIIYALHVLLSPPHRALLHPQHPYLGVFAPWVHQSHTSSLLNLTSVIPAAAIGNFHNIVGFVNKRIAPAFGWSSGVMAKVLPDTGGAVAVPEAAKGGTDGVKWGEDDAVVTMSAEERMEEEYRWECIMKFAFAEGMKGASDDALLFLKRTGFDDPWGEWEDIDKAVVLLAKQEAELARSRGADREGGLGVGAGKLKVEVFYAEDDRMSGSKGAEWFGQCWDEEKRGSWIEFEGRTWPGTDHDGILGRRYGLLERWCRGVRRMYERVWREEEGRVKF